MDNINHELQIFKELDFNEIIEKTKELHVELPPFLAFIWLQIIKEKINHKEIGQFINISIIYDESMDDELIANENMSIDFTTEMMNVLLSNPQIKESLSKSYYNLPIYGVTTLNLEQFISNNEDEHVELLSKLNEHKELKTTFLPLIYNIIDLVKEKELLEQSVNIHIDENKHKSLKL
jgi:hypothetical protein